ncbi:hypothetical protein [Saccharopolyspora sp. NPDC002686]|uniref:hypothetical protein n=1 Tax=Saccharopolyspora sp. NPDC002686 TaxID=3154541 RepID=UPI00331B1CA3
MPESLIEVVSPQLSAPVTRKPIDTAATGEDGIGQSMFRLGEFTIAFAGDDDE